ncbi:hypothetical protein KGP36_06165 [Patescibacteria group bacterium]|nr:hypothetical protein [Patescibacteria group bacterium]
MADFAPPGQPPQTPGVPENFSLIIFDGFEGLNTKSSRPAIQDREISWCDNFMPIGKSNLRTIPDAGAAIYTASGGRTIVHCSVFTPQSGITYILIFLSDGAIDYYAVGVGQGNLALAGTYTVHTPIDGSNPIKARPSMTQWGGNYAIIVNPETTGNGLFMWDTTSLYKSGTLGPDVTFHQSGANYSSAPTITAYGGSGTGATFSPIIQNGSITKINVTNPGTGYGQYDAPVLKFSGGHGTAFDSATGHCVMSNNSVQSVTIDSGGAGYNNAASVSVQFIGGGGTGATATVSISGGAVTSVTITAGGFGYISAPTPFFLDPNNQVAAATVDIMPFGVSGNNAETYFSRLWIANGNRGLFTAAGTAGDFNIADGAGAFQSTDAFLRIFYSSFKQSNGFLYLIGDSSVNYISGVQTAGSPPITTFSNLNVDPQIGTPWKDTVQVFSRAIILANPIGVFALYGGSIEKISTAIDTTYASATVGSGTILPSAAVATLYSIPCYCLLYPIIDPITNTSRNALLMWDGKRWFTASQTPNLKEIFPIEWESELTAWGHDGTSVYQLFAANSNRTKTVQSKLWDSPSYVTGKSAVRVSTLSQINSGNVGNISISIDSNRYTPQIINEPINLGATNFLTTSSRCNQYGELIGMTITTTAPDMTLLSATIVAEQPYETEI